MFHGLFTAPRFLLFSRYGKQSILYNIFDSHQHNFTANAAGSYIKKECTYLYTLTQSHHSTSSHTTMPCQLFNRPLQFLRGLTVKSLPDSALLIDWQRAWDWAWDWDWAWAWDCLKLEDTRSKKNIRNSKYTEVVYHL